MCFCFSTFCQSLDILSSSLSSLLLQVKSYRLNRSLRAKPKLISIAASNLLVWTMVVLQHCFRPYCKIASPETWQAPEHMESSVAQHLNTYQAEHFMAQLAETIAPA